MNSTQRHKLFSLFPFAKFVTFCSLLFFVKFLFRHFPNSPDGVRRGRPKGGGGGRGRGRSLFLVVSQPLFATTSPQGRCNCTFLRSVFSDLSDMLGTVTLFDKKLPAFDIWKWRLVDIFHFISCFVISSHFISIPKRSCDEISPRNPKKLREKSISERSNAMLAEECGFSSFSLLLLLLSSSSSFPLLLLLKPLS